MTLVSLKNGTLDNANLLKFEFSDGTFLKVKDFYLNFYYKSPVSWDFYTSFEPGREISPDEEAAFRFCEYCFRAEKTGMRLIARAEQTQAGLSRKLEARGHDTACVRAVMAWFTEEDLVNDERYAERWLRSRLSRSNGKIPGPQRLSAALGNRGIKREAIRNAFDKVLDEDAEYALLERFIKKDKNSKVTGSYSLRSRLRYEGFSSPVINRYLDENDDYY